MAKIVNITEAVSIALHSMVIIANSDTQVNVKKIAELTGSSKFHIAKIMQNLVKAGFLSSQRGPTGGFELLIPPEEITLLDIYETIEGKITISRCPLNKETCPFGKCIFEDLTVKMTKEFKDYLQNKKLTDYKNF